MGLPLHHPNGAYTLFKGDFMKARGIISDDTIRLHQHVDLPSGTEVEITIEVGPDDHEIQRRRHIARRILDRASIPIAPLTVRELIEDGRER